MQLTRPVRPYARLTILLALLAAGCSSRIPTRAQLEADQLGDEARGRRVVERAVAAHGGRAAFDALEDVTFRLTDDWHGLASSTSPWPVPDPAVLSYTYNFGLNKGRIEFADDPTLVWGHDSVEGWIEISGRRTYDDVDTATFAVPTEAYFVALPFKFLDPGVRLSWAGMREHDGRSLETVLVAFDDGVGAVQDRYLAYFDPDDGRLVYTTFTVYEESSFLEGSAFYPAWQHVDGLLLPERIEVGAVRPFEMDAHTLIVSDVDLDADVDPRTYEKPDSR